MKAVKADRRELAFGRLKFGCVYMLEVLLEASPDALSKRPVVLLAMKEGSTSIVMLGKETRTAYQHKLQVYVLAEAIGQIDGCLRFTGAGASIKPIAITAEVLDACTFEQSRRASAMPTSPELGCVN